MNLQKDGITPSMSRKKRRARLDRDERGSKSAVRARDRNCRFPLCGCQGFDINPLKGVQTVSHDFHKGMGGDPTGGVSIPSLMILLCKWRHQDGRISMHAKTLRTRYLTPDHNDGPVAFDIKHAALPLDAQTMVPVHRWEEWVEVAVEGSVGFLTTLKGWQYELLVRLARMDI